METTGEGTGLRSDDCLSASVPVSLLVLVFVSLRLPTWLSSGLQCLAISFYARQQSLWLSVQGKGRLCSRQFVCVSEGPVAHVACLFAFLSDLL